MSDRIVVLNEGRAEQIGTPFEIYNHPCTRFAASFIGTLGTLDGEAAGPGRMRVDGQEIETPAFAAAPGTALTLALRPEALSLAAAPDRTNRLVGRVEDVHFLGSVVRMRIGFGRNTLLLDAFNNPGFPPPERDQTVAVHFAPEDGRFLDRPPEVALAAE